MIFLARASYVKEYVGEIYGNITVYNDNNKVLSWDYGKNYSLIGTRHMEYHSSDYREHISAGTHKFHGTLTCSDNNGNWELITGNTSVFILFIPD